VQFKKLQKILASKGKNIETANEAAMLAPSESAGVSSKPLVGRLTEDRIQRLQSLGFVWSLRDDWQKHYEELEGVFSSVDESCCNNTFSYELIRFPSCSIQGREWSL
jgi:hypothetical protein